MKPILLLNSKILGAVIFIVISNNCIFLFSLALMPWIIQRNKFCSYIVGPNDSPNSFIAVNVNINT